MPRDSRGLDGFSCKFERDRLSDWAIHVLERAGRKDEIILLCEAEAKKTGNYERLVNLLVSARRYEEAERWIREGIRAIKDKWPGTAQTHAPDRAVAISKNKAKRLIAQVKPKAYQQAGKYLRKAAKVMANESKLKEWGRYLQRLREHHTRKIRLMEVLDSLDDKPIIRKRL